MIMLKPYVKPANCKFYASLLLLMLFVVPTTFAQTRILKREVVGSNAPYSILSLKYKDKQIEFDKPFEADMDWWKDINFSIKNTSQKRIVCIYMRLVFPDVAIPYPLSEEKFIGQPTNTKIRVENPTLLLQPNEVLAISLEPQYEKVKDIEAYQNLRNNVQTVRLGITRVYFEDGTMWDLGETYRPNPDVAGRWLKVEQRSANQPE